MTVPHMLHELKLRQMNHTHVNSDVYKQHVAQRRKPAVAANTTRPESQNSDEQHKVDAIYYRRQSNAACSHHHGDDEVAEKISNHRTILKQPSVLSGHISSTAAARQCCRGSRILGICTALVQQNSAADEDQQSNEENSDIRQKNPNCVQRIVKVDPATNASATVNQSALTYQQRQCGKILWQDCLWFTLPLKTCLTVTVTVLRKNR